MGKYHSLKLIAFYPFNGNANDESGNGNHGTVYGATLTTDRFNQPNRAYYFDGINDYIMVPNSSILQISGEITMSAWFQTRSAKPHANILCKSEVQDPRDGYLMGIDPKQFCKGGYMARTIQQIKVR